MDREQFDTLARLVWSKQTRRAALGTILGAALLGSGLDSAAKSRGKKKRKRKKKARICYTGANCIPGPGKDNAGCDFSGSVTFFEGDFSGSSFRGANLTGAEMAGANLQGVDLGRACLVGTNLLEADLGGANLDGAIVCATLMPDGTTNDSGCGKGTRCCPTPDPVCSTCEGCINTLNAICNNVFTTCCAPLTCTSSISVIVTSCQQPCTSDADCTIFPNATKCCVNQLLCPFLPGARCCQDPNDPAGCG